MIVHYRMEDSFIQGVITTHVFAHYPCNGILIFDNDLLEDTALQTMISLSIPPNIKLYFFGLEEALTHLEKAEQSSKNYYVIVRNPIIALSLLRIGYDFKLPITCGQQPLKDGAYNIMKGVALTDEEAEALDTLLESGVNILFDPGGTQNNISWEKVRKAYENARKKYSTNIDDNKNTSLNKTFTILDCFLSDNNIKLTVSEIQKETQIPFSTCYRLTVFLEENGYLHKDEKTKAYSLGWRMIQFARNYSDVSMDKLLRSISPFYLDYLQNKYNETVSIYTRIGQQYLCISTIPNTHAIQFRPQLDRLMKLDKSAPSLILISSLSKSFRQKLEIYDKDIQGLLRQVESDGYAITSSQGDEGIISIAAPIRVENSILAGALALQGPNFRFSNDNLEEKITEIQSTANRLSSELKQAYLLNTI